MLGRSGDHGGGGCGGQGRINYRPGQGGYNNKKKGWTSSHPELKYDVFEEGTLAKAAQYTDTMKRILQYINISGMKEARLIATHWRTDDTDNTTAAKATANRRPCQPKAVHRQPRQNSNLE